MSTTAFRCLILASFAMQLCAAFVDALFPSLISPALLRAVEAERLPSALEHSWVIALLAALAITLLVAEVGLLFFKRWARTASLWGTFLSLPMYSAFGTTVESSVSGALAEASSVLWGAVLAIAFFSPLRMRFVPSNNGS